jgi:hypothetical protein
MPDLIRANDMGGEDVEYLMPFLVQDTAFPYVVHYKTVIPAQVSDLMERIHEELPAISPLSRLSVKTYLKMILLLLVKHYAGYGGTEEIFYLKQKAIERLRSLFEYIDHHYGDPITVDDAASIVCMSPTGTAGSKGRPVWWMQILLGQPFCHFQTNRRQSRITAPPEAVGGL